MPLSKKNGVRRHTKKGIKTTTLNPLIKNLKKEYRKKKQNAILKITRKRLHTFIRLNDLAKSKKTSTNNLAN